MGRDDLLNACTLWPDKFGSYDLSAACALHDEDYEEQRGFILSNIRLGKNVGGWLGVLMVVGTTLLGWPWYLKAKRRGV